MGDDFILFRIKAGLFWQKIFEIPEQRARVGGRGNMSFHVYTDENRGGHHYPHFHVRGGGKEAAVIYQHSGIKVIGVLDKKAMKTVKEWAAENKEYVLRIYQEHNGTLVVPIM